MAEALIYDLCKAVASKLKEEGFQLSGVPKEAKKMERNLEAIKAVLKAAEQREVDDGVKQWIRDLKDVAYDIEDVLDDWSIAKLQMQDQAGTSQRGNMSIPQGCFSCFPSSPCFFFKQAKSRHDIADAIIEINKRLDDIDERKKKFDFPTTITSKSEGPKREAITTSYEYYDDVVSQKILKAKLIKQLVDSDLNRSVADLIPIISIVGMGGLGKTTVARLLYNDETLKNHFSHKIAWVCVSNNFDAMKVAKDIFRELTGKPAEESALQSLLTRIENSIRGTKFFLVLDDVWETSEKKWNPILKCLSKGDAQGSRILMTSRDSNFSPIMRVDIVPMNKLSKAEAMSLFSYYAFPGDPDHRGEVEDIAVQLVEKCDGLPLALQVLGSHMADKTTRSQWNDVLSSEMWKMKFQDEVFNSLAFSYIELRSETKRCFAFCSVFPKDTIMWKSILIRMWTAQGYLEGTDQMEVLGEECFHSLLRRSFFRVCKSYSDEDTDIAVTMHDIVHDFAQYISKDDVAILDPSNVEKGSANLRHLTFSREISESECPLSSLNLRALRTLFVCTHKSAPILDGLCSNKSSIRALSMYIYSESETLDNYDIKDIGKLIHLRYVELSSMNLIVLPEEICRLPYLQTLDVWQCFNLEKLPNDIGRLTMLRHLLFDGTKMNSLPKGLGKLSSLQTLSEFICGGLANEDCSRLEDLRDLNNLRGDLTLRNLNNVANVDEATRASLSKKTHIRQLKLLFGDGDASLQSKVLKALQPAKENLLFLKISEYRGKLCPPWTGQMQYLKKVELEQVGMESLPKLGTLRSLEYLLVKGANEVRHVGAELFGKVTEGQSFFPKLESLHFKNMANWEHWDGPEEIMRSGVTVMSSLRSLKMYKCEALKTLPRFLEHVPIESFKVDSCHLPPVDVAEDDHPKRWHMGDILLPQTLKIIETPYVTLRQEEAPFQPEASQVVQQQHLNFNCVEIGSHNVLSTVTVPGWIMDFAYLRKVTLFKLEDVWLPPLGSLAYLEELTIWGAEKVEKVGDEFLGDHTEVRHVGAEIFGKVKEGQSFFPKLESLYFKNMANWKHWDGPEQIMRSGATVMPSLRKLRMYKCRALQTLPRFLEHVPLESFRVDSCHLPPVDLAENEYPKRWRIGDILLPQTLKIIETPYVTLRQEEAPFQPEASQVVQQQHLNFNCVGIGSYYVLSTVTVPGWIMDFAYLRKVTLFKLEDVWLPPLGSLAYLEELTIGNAEKVEKVGDEFLGLSTSNNNKDGDHGGRGASTTPFIAFPKLKELSFVDMPAWREWEDPVHGNNLIIMPSLCELSIRRCEKLKSLPHFFEAPVSLKTLWLGATTDGDLPKIRSTTNTGEDEAAYEMSKARSTTTTPAQLEFRQITLYDVRNEWLLDWTKYCVRLRELRLVNCAEASYVRQLEVSLPSLETLYVSASDFRRTGMELLSISSLKTLYLRDMSKWEEWDDAPPHQPEIISDESRELSQHGNNNNFTSNLRALSLYGCPKLKALPSFLRSVSTLEELHINNSNSQFYSVLLPILGGD